MHISALGLFKSGRSETPIPDEGDYSESEMDLGQGTDDNQSIDTETGAERSKSKRISFKVFIMARMDDKLHQEWATLQ